MLARCHGCTKAREDVMECAVQIGGRRKVSRLCADCRTPFEALMESTPGRGRGKRRTGPLVPTDPALIPLDRPPMKRAPTRLR